MTQFKKLALLTVVTLVGGNVNAAAAAAAAAYGDALSFHAPDFVESPISPAEPVATNGLLAKGMNVARLGGKWLVDFEKTKTFRGHNRPAVRGNLGRFAAWLAIFAGAGYVLNKGYVWAKGKWTARKEAKQIAADAALAARMEAEGTAERSAVRRRL